MEFPIFLSVVLVVRNQSKELSRLLSDATATIGSLVCDYELIIVDNASADDSVAILKSLTGEDGLANLQVYALTKEVDSDTASWVGLENALGDFIAVIDPLTDDIHYLPSMLEHAVKGADVVFALNAQKPRQSLVYRACFSIFNTIYKAFNGIHIAKDAPQYRVLSRRVVNFVLQHPTPSVTYRHLTANGGFANVHLAYSAKPKLGSTRKSISDSFDRGMRLLVSTTHGPMRLVTSLSLFGAVSNLLYSAYVIAVAIFKDDVAEGWVTLSLQQSGMFFLVSLVLLVLGEYILHMTNLANEGPQYYVGQEFTSAVMTRREKLNIEEVRATEKTARSPIHLANEEPLYRVG